MPALRRSKATRTRVHVSVAHLRSHDVYRLQQPGSPHYSRVDASPEASDTLSPPDLEKVVTKTQGIPGGLHSDFELRRQVIVSLIGRHGPQPRRNLDLTRSAGLATAAPRQPDPRPAASLTGMLSGFACGAAAWIVVLKMSYVPMRSDE